MSKRSDEKSRKERVLQDLASLLSSAGRASVTIEKRRLRGTVLVARDFDLDATRALHIPARPRKEYALGSFRGLTDLADALGVDRSSLQHTLKGYKPRQFQVIIPQ